MSHPAEDGGATWVLAVDADPRVLEAIQLALESLGGLRVCLAMSTATVSEGLTRVRPSVLVLDPALPGTDVKDLVARVRGAMERPPPLLVITADGRGAGHAAELGAYAFLAKPFGPDELLACVRKGLALAGRRDGAGP